MRRKAFNLAGVCEAGICDVCSKAVNHVGVCDVCSKAVNHVGVCDVCKEAFKKLTRLMFVTDTCCKTFNQASVYL